MHELIIKNGKLASEIVRMLSEGNCLLGLSESITGGQISAFLTKIDGCSKVLFGSCVVYSHLGKASFSHIPLNTLEEKGTVSEFTVSEMNESMANRILSMLEEVSSKRGYELPSHVISVATSGVAGDPIEGKPRGFVYIGIKLDKIARSPVPARTEVFNLVSRFNFKGSREEIILQASLQSLELVTQLPIFRKSD